MGIVGLQVYQSKFGPSYHVSYGTSIGLLSGTIIFVGVSWALMGRGTHKQGEILH